MPLSAPSAASQVGDPRQLPARVRRELEPAELRQIQSSSDRWFPKPNASLATPLTELLASPTKSAAAYGAPFALFGALFGSILGSMSSLRRDFLSPGLSGGGSGGSSRLPLAVFGALLFGGVGALLGYNERQRENENLIDQIRRNPPGALYRDMLDDPAVRHDSLVRELRMGRVHGRRY